MHGPREGRDTCSRAHRWRTRSIITVRLERTRPCVSAAMLTPTEKLPQWRTTTQQETSHYTNTDTDTRTHGHSTTSANTAKQGEAVRRPRGRQPRDASERKRRLRGVHTCVQSMRERERTREYNEVDCELPTARAYERERENEWESVREIRHSSLRAAHTPYERGRESAAALYERERERRPTARGREMLRGWRRWKFSERRFRLLHSVLNSQAKEIRKLKGEFE